MAYDRYQDAVLATGLPRHHDELLYRRLPVVIRRCVSSPGGWPSGTGPAESRAQPDRIDHEHLQPCRSGSVV